MVKPIVTNVWHRPKVSILHIRDHAKIARPRMQKEWGPVICCWDGPGMEIDAFPLAAVAVRAPIAENCSIAGTSVTRFIRHACDTEELIL